jgi:ribulose-5-phosphate 4-epimerase/fuculose-1-phosphate aldolase
MDTHVYSGAGIDADEWRVRIDLAACYRLLAHFGMTDLIYTHVSARVPKQQGHFLINPYGLMFHEVTASSLVKVNHAGGIVEPTPYTVNPPGFVIHSAVHMARPDAACVLHSHTRASIAVSCLEQGLMPLTQKSFRFYGRMAYHAYEGISLDLNERERLAADLGDKYAMLLRNHGALTVGRTIPEAFELMYALETVCRIQIDVLSSGQKIVLPPPEIAAKAAAQFVNDEEPAGERVWAGLLRLLDAQNPGYRD